MKRIFILMDSMKVAGTAKTLIDLLKVLPLDVFEVHLGLLYAKGAFMEQIPQDIHIHELPKPRGNKDTFLSLIKSFHWIDAILFLLLWIYNKYSRNDFRLYHYRYSNISDNNGFFDLAIAYSNLSVYYLCKKVDAKAKCCWIHQDVTVPKNRIPYKMREKYYHYMDRIFVVSEEGKVRFDSVFPQMKDKTDVFHNIIPVDHVIKMAKIGESFNDDFNGKRLLTVGRISSEKGFLLAIKALRILLDKGHHVNWYIIGGEIGNDYYKECMELATQENVAEHLIFLDVQMNPYRFMQDCDIYVQPSLYESFCITLAEALCFGNPIVCTNFCGVEQMKGRTNGYITEMTAGSLADGIINALNDKKIAVSPIQKQPDIDKLMQLINN